MSQNRSSAVMQQRAEPHDSLDFFPTPHWATRALCEHVLPSAMQDNASPLSTYAAWEPACGQGHMVDALREYFGAVWATDVHPYGHGGVRDFLMADAAKEKIDWVITNPPFRLASQFILQGRHIAPNVAMLVRIAFLEGVGRYNELFSQHPPNIIAQFVERVPMVKGRLSREATTATAYCWLVWHLGSGSRFMWIPPCRKRLERAGDYP